MLARAARDTAEILGSRQAPGAPWRRQGQPRGGTRLGWRGQLRRIDVVPEELTEFVGGDLLSVRGQSPVRRAAGSNDRV